MEATTKMLELPDEAFDDLPEGQLPEGAETNRVKLTDWKNEPTLENLKQDYTDSQTDHATKTQRINVWLDNLNIEGKAKIKKKAGRSNIVPKLIRKQAEWRYASLSEPFLSTDDIFNTAPVTHKDKEAAKQNALVLNNQFNTKIAKIRFVDEFVRAAVDEGTVICRTSWVFKQIEEEVEVPVYTYQPIVAMEDMQMMQQASQMLQQDPTAEQDIDPAMLASIQASTEMGQPLKAVQTGVEMQTQMRTVANHPNVEVCNHNNVVIDPSCLGELENAKFAIYSFSTSLSELEEDGKYVNLDKISIETSSILGESDYSGDSSNRADDFSFNFNDKPRKKFVAYEYWGFWDIDGSGLVKPIVSTWVGDTLIRMEENPFPDKALPFVTAQYLPVRKSIYGEPDGELLEDNQRIIGAVTRGMIDIMGRSANGQQASRKDALDVTNRRKFDRGQDYEFNSQVDPKQAFHTHTFPEIPQSAPLMIQMQNQEAESLSGVKAFAQGINGDSLGSNATGQRGAMDATAKRELGILRRLAEAMKQIGRKFISMNGELLEEEEVVRITDEEFVTVKRDDLAGNFDLILTISTAEADNAKAEELSFMLQTTAQSMGPEFTQIILSDIATLRKMPALAKKIEEYQPQPDPLEQEKQQLEIELLKAQIANEQAKANENNANAALDNAKAEEISSNTDLQDLEFVEKESGVTQERDLEKAGAQADANKELEGVKHGYNMREKVADAAIERSKPTPPTKK